MAKAKSEEVTKELRKQLRLGGTRKTIATKAFKALQKRGITHNSKGFEIKIENVLRLENSMLSDITRQKKGWWMTNKIEETENGEVKMVKKVEIVVDKNKVKKV